MIAHRIAPSGFAIQRGDRVPRRYAVSAQLIATLALVVSLLVSGTAVSIGIAHANDLARTDAAALVKAR